MAAQETLENATSTALGALGGWFDPQKILFILIVLAATAVAATIIRNILQRTLPRWLPTDISRALIRLFYYGTWTLGIIIILQDAFDIPLGSLLVAGGLAGIVIGFASQTVVSNLLSGIFIYFDRPLKVGDAIELPDQGISGVVTDINIMSTRIRTWDGLNLRIPNEKLFNSVIKNIYGTVARRVEYRIGISYSSDIEKAKQIIKEAAHRHPYALAEPEPFVFVEEYGDSAIILNARVWAPTRKWFDVKTSLLEEIKKRFDEEGIEIPFPQVVNWFPEPLQVIKKDTTDNNEKIHRESPEGENPRS